MKKSIIFYILALIFVIIIPLILIYDYFNGTRMPFYKYIIMRIIEFGILAIISLIIGIILRKKEKN